VRKSDKQFPQAVVRFVNSLPQRVSANRLPLAFVHINKTAGTSFTEYLAALFRGTDGMAPPYFGNFQEIGLNDLRRRLYWGHFTCSEWQKHGRQAWMITFLRDPQQRVMSQYRSHHNPDNLRDKWSQVIPREAREALEFAQRASFEEFILSDHPFILRHIRVLQTRFLSSCESPDDPKFLSSAIHHLSQSILFFGITERFPRSIRLFDYQLGLSRKHALAREPRRNVSRPYDVELTDRGRERLEWLTQNDSKLYRCAVEIFEQRYLRVFERESESTDAASWAA
jgi:hypothetical protein